MSSAERLSISCKGISLSSATGLLLSWRKRTGSRSRNRLNLLGNHPCKPFMKGEAQSADTFAAQSEGSCQDEVGAVWFEEIGGANIGAEAPCDQCDHVHQRLGGFAAFAREIADFLQRQY